MTQEEKELLLEDLCARLPYGVICHYNCAIRCDTMEINKANCVGKLEGIIPFNDHIGFMIGGDKVNALFGDIKPYLRPLSSMTEDEVKEVLTISNFCPDNEDIYNGFIRIIERGLLDIADIATFIKWLCANHFDFLGLIPIGLAIEVTEENNPYKD